MKKVLIFSWCGVPILFIQACQNLLKQPALNCLDCLAYDWNESNFFNSLGALGFVPFRQNLAYIYNKWAIRSLGLQLQNCLLCSYSDERFFVCVLGSKAMGFCDCRVLVVLICIGCLAFQPGKVCGLRNMDLVLRWNEGHGQAAENWRLLKAVDAKDVNIVEQLAPAPSALDPNQSNKRRVRRGSDPIHNKC